MKKRLFLSVVLCAVTSFSWAQTSVVWLNDSNDFADGVTYFLPKTELVVVAEVKHRICKAGPFYKYAERYLGVSDIVTENADSWQLVDVRLRSRIMPDETKRFGVAVNKKTTAYNLQLDNNQIIKSVNVIAEKTQSRPQKSHQKPEKSVLDTLFDMTQLGEDALVATSIPKMAEMAAKQIFMIRESRTNLLVGDNENLPDGAALQLMLKRLDEAERELVALFVGKTATHHQTKTYHFLPEEVAENQVIFRISKHEGLVSAENMLGEPVYLSVEPKRVNQPNLLSENKTNGLFYNVSGSALVKVSDGKTIFAEKSFTVPQFGMVRCLPAMLFDKKSTQVEFTKYGEIKSISE